MWPRFSGNSYLKLPGVSGLATHTAIEIQFFPTYGEGVLLYFGHSDTVNGDFMALGLSENKPVFRLNLGKFIDTTNIMSIIVILSCELTIFKLQCIM